jgi:hypothetical protein
MGSEAGTGMLVLSPRAVERLESYVPDRPLPKIFRLTSKGKLIEGLFKGETINTPSMLANEDYLFSLEWGQSIGGLPELMARATATPRRSTRGCSGRPGSAISPPIRRSAPTPACACASRGWTTRPRPRSKEDGGAARGGRRRLRHRQLSRRPSRPAGLVRLDVDTADIEALCPWLDWAYAQANRLTILALPPPGGGLGGGPCWTPPLPHQAHPPTPALPPEGGGGKKDHIMPKVLISDKMDPRAAQIFRERGIQVDEITGKTKDELIAIIGDYDGLAIRSATKVTKDVLAAGRKLKVVGRAGIGVDNVDIPAASAAGVVVMNTPVRQFDHDRRTCHRADVRARPPAARGGRLDPGRQVGEEPLHGGRAHLQDARPDRRRQYRLDRADRAHGLKMKVVAYDPFLTPERAVALGVEKVELAELLARADFITLHTPLTDQTRNILSRENLAKAKKGVRIINCARGGLVDEAALKEMLKAAMSPARRSTCSWRNLPRRTPCSARPASSRRRTSARPPPRRRSMSRSRSPNRWRISSSPAESPTP